jgi:carbonic anhydrase
MCPQQRKAAVLIDPMPEPGSKADAERLLAAPPLSPKVSVSGHVYDIVTGRVTTTVDARYP